METIELIPNYEHMFKVMLKDARTQGKVEHMFTSRRYRQELLREVQRWLAPLTIAVNCATTTVAIEEIRSVMADMLAALDQEALRLEQEEYEKECNKRDAFAQAPGAQEGLL